MFNDFRLGVEKCKQLFWSSFYHVSAGFSLFFNDFICSWEGSMKSRSRCNFCKASASTRAARAALSLGSACGAGQLCGKNFTDLAICLDLDFGRYTSWHLQWSIAGPRYHANAPFLSQVWRFSRVLWTIVLHPGGASGWAL